MGDTVAVNRKAWHEYSIEDTLEAGIALTGTEIKSVRAGRTSLQEAYARIERGEVWLVGATIAPWTAGTGTTTSRAAIASSSSTGSRSTSCSARPAQKG